MSQQNTPMEGIVDFLRENNIKRIYGRNAETYVACTGDNAFFDITFYDLTNQYLIRPIGCFAGYDPKYIFNAMAYGHRVQELSKMGNGDISRLYTQAMVDSDINLEKRANFETYVVTYKDVIAYAVGYDPKTQKYGFKRYLLMNDVHKCGNIPLDKKPDYAKLYKQTKDFYNAQIVVQNMLDFEIE